MTEDKVALTGLRSERDSKNHEWHYAADDLSWTRRQRQAGAEFSLDVQIGAMGRRPP